MGNRTPLVGREAESAVLAAALDRARQGSGTLLLLSGDAGVGKTRLADEVALGSSALVLRGAATNSVTPPYGPIVAALRSYLRTEPDGLADCGPLRSHLALLLPELGEPAAESDRSTIFEAVRCAFAHLTDGGPALVVLDDLQWSDQASLELLAALAAPIRELPIVVVAVYRSDGLPRDHTLRWLRNELRRGGNLEELALEPLDREQTGALLGDLLAEQPSESLLGTIHDRTQGSPFFVEELVAALRVRDRLHSGPRGLELAEESEVPIPDTIRDAVAIGASELSEPAREAAEVAAVADQPFDLGSVAGPATKEGLVELIDKGHLVEEGAGRAAFRHALVRDAVYAEVPWLRRRAIHRRLAEALEQGEGTSMEIAMHWSRAGDAARARAAFVEAVRRSEDLHAYRDATKAAREALELWSEGEEDELRVETLERYARCAELAGELTEAAKALRELAAIRSSDQDSLGFARTQHRLAAVYDLKGERDTAFAARRLAAEAFAANEMAADAALERLTMADHQRARAGYGEAIELSQAALEDAQAAERLDLAARARGLLGVAQAKGGEFETGLETVRGALALALDHDLTPVAAELYQRLSMVLYDASDYRRAEEALDTALGLCRTGEDVRTELACVTCLVYVLRERGEWSRAGELGRELIDSGTAVWVAEGLVGAIHAFQGKLASARRMLSASRSVSAAVGHYNMFMDATTGLAYVAAAEGAEEEAAEHCRTLLARWEDSEDHHYAVWGIRWATAFFARRGDRERVHACTEALATMASEASHGDALAALAQAIGEMAVLDGDDAAAAEHFSRAVELHRPLAVPFERAQIELRAGVVLAAAGEREQALERLCDSYRTASKLGARPLASAAAREVADLGESVAQRLGGRAATRADDVQLTRRELEVLRFVSIGRTNREIAQELFISPRTVDMHVRNLLGKLECRSRVEASHRAGELGLLA
ncbi:MAG TPA: AAA family ATPase [Solirubrobacterales bacterium]|nr:AAA family ATPase [Solirubrobacterales bacterium]